MSVKTKQQSSITQAKVDEEQKKGTFHSLYQEKEIYFCVLTLLKVYTVKNRMEQIYQLWLLSVSVSLKTFPKAILWNISFKNKMTNNCKGGIIFQPSSSSWPQCGAYFKNFVPLFMQYFNKLCSCNYEDSSLNRGLSQCFVQECDWRMVNSDLCNFK